MLLPALSRLVGVISRHGGYRGNPIPITMEEISETVCIDKPPQLAGVPVRLLALRVILPARNNHVAFR
jgi:hypothetical protein